MILLGSVQTHFIFRAHNVSGKKVEYRGKRKLFSNLGEKKKKIEAASSVERALAPLCAIRGYWSTLSW